MNAEECEVGDLRRLHLCSSIKDSLGMFWSDERVGVSSSTAFFYYVKKEYD